VLLCLLRHDSGCDRHPCRRPRQRALRAPHAQSGRYAPARSPRAIHTILALPTSARPQARKLRPRHVHQQRLPRRVRHVCRRAPRHRTCRHVAHRARFLLCGRALSSALACQHSCWCTLAARLQRPTCWASPPQLCCCYSSAGVTRCGERRRHGGLGQHGLSRRARQARSWRRFSWARRARQRWERGRRSTSTRRR
jgi:hypothetical protein